MGFNSADLCEELPAYNAYTTRLRTRESNAASRMLMLAAGLAVLRAGIVPWYMKFTYTPLELRLAPSHSEMVMTGVVTMSLFVLCGLWSRFAPIVATLIALASFIAMGIRDYMTMDDLLNQGPIYKILVLILLLRAFMNAAMSRTI